MKMNKFKVAVAFVIGIIIGLLIAASLGLSINSASSAGCAPCKCDTVTSDTSSLNNTKPEMVQAPVLVEDNNVAVIQKKKVQKEIDTVFVLVPSIQVVDTIINSDTVYVPVKVTVIKDLNTATLIDDIDVSSGQISATNAQFAEDTIRSVVKNTIKLGKERKKIINKMNRLESKKGSFEKRALLEKRYFEINHLIFINFLLMDNTCKKLNYLVVSDDNTVSHSQVYWPGERFYGILLELYILERDFKFKK